MKKLFLLSTLFLTTISTNVLGMHHQVIQASIFIKAVVNKLNSDKNLNLKIIFDENCDTELESMNLNISRSIFNLPPKTLWCVLNYILYLKSYLIIKTNDNEFTIQRTNKKTYFLNETEFLNDLDGLLK